MTNTTPQGGEPVWSDYAIDWILAFLPYDDRSTLTSILRNRRDIYEAELSRLRETIGARDRLIGHLSRQLDEARKPMRVVVQPDFEIDFGDDNE